MEEDLLTLIGEEKGVTNCIVLTHNIDFVFLQTLVIDALRKCGHPKLTILADEQCALESFAYQRDLLSGLGSRFRVVPVAMERGFRFHPKAVLLSSPQNATLFVGSGNLTFGGWRTNAEVWVRFDFEIDGAAPFGDFREYLNLIVARLSLHEEVLAEIDEAFDPVTKVWCNPAPKGNGSALLGHAGAGNSLLDRMLALTDPDPNAKLRVCAPYFDGTGDALAALATRASPAAIEVWIEQGRTNLSAQARAKFPASATTYAIRYRRQAEPGSAPVNAFVHAKFFAMARDAQVHVFAGSANCSSAALTIPGRNGNAELVASLRMTPSEYQESFVEMLDVGEIDPVLPDADVLEPDPHDDQGFVRLAAARYEDTALTLGFQCSDGITIHSCRANGEVRPLSLKAPGVAVVAMPKPPGVVSLVGDWNGQSVESNELWVDRERDLRATAKGRTAGEKIRKKSGASDFGLGDWAEIFEAFGDDLAYISATGAHRSRITGWNRPKDAEKVTYGIGDIFADHYGLPRASSFLGGGNQGSLNLTLPQLLMRWFAMDGIDPNQKPPDPADPGKVPLKPPPKPPSPPSPDTKPAGSTEKQRAEKAVASVIQSMTSAKFLGQRHPEQLGRDLRICALLLTIGLRRSYIDQERFLGATRAIWAAMFFAPVKDDDEATYVGWLDRRFREADDPDAFVQAMQSPQLSAALAGWALAMPSSRDPQVARFYLSHLLSIGRLPWLWAGGGTESIATELSNMLRHTDSAGPDDEERWRSIEDYWRTAVRRGAVLHTLEQTLAPHTPADLRLKIPETAIRPGELLWQGVKKGFCIAKSAPYGAESGSVVDVLTLQDELPVTFQAPFAIPVRALLHEESSRALTQLDEKQGAEVEALIDQLVAGFGPPRTT